MRIIPYYVEVVHSKERGMILWTPKPTKFERDWQHGKRPRPIVEHHSTTKSVEEERLKQRTPQENGGSLTGLYSIFLEERQLL
ncbi:hypothetical protein FRC18_008280 [Serendipita sp. 400]|nr:hypothetical protein FRC18_008280 [Serendipita sp. 400]